MRQPAESPAFLVPFSQCIVDIVPQLPVILIQFNALENMDIRKKYTANPEDR